MSKIPKNLIQTNMKKPENHILQKLSEVFIGWNYKNYETDEERIIFFQKNPIKDFPDIINIYNILQGAHKSDLFRYYYLYLFGGCYLDDDAMVYEDINKIIKDYDSVFIKSNFFDDFTHIFNGFICTYPKNPILYEAIKHLYTVDYSNARKNYQFACKELYNIIQKLNSKNIKIYEGTLKITEKNNKSIIYGDDNEIILIHYFQEKKVPRIKIDITNITLLIRSYNRSEYLKNTLESLQKSDIYLCNEIIIYDDCSEDKELIDLLNNYKFINNIHKNIKVIISNKNEGCKKSYISALDKISKNSNLIITIDNDVIVTKNFISEIVRGYKESYFIYNTTNFLLTGFNPTNAHLNKIYDNYITYRKKTCGGINFIFHINFLHFIKKYWNINLDWSVVDNMLLNNYPLLCLKKGVINHIGKIGLYSNNDSYDYDNTFTYN